MLKHWHLKAFVVINLCASVAAAHPVDILCVDGHRTEDGCQENTPGLNFNDPEFFEAHRRYWHCRRSLVVEDIVEYAQCVGNVRSFLGILGWPTEYGDENLLKYWNVIPAHPELDYPGEVWRPLQQLEACEATREIAKTLKWECRSMSLWLLELVNEREKPVECPVCPVCQVCKKGKRR